VLTLPIVGTFETISQPAVNSQYVAALATLGGHLYGRMVDADEAAMDA
jgi:hypothetical protein